VLLHHPELCAPSRGPYQHRTLYRGLVINELGRNGLSLQREVREAQAEFGDPGPWNHGRMVP
jgi:hypothetical protein